MDCNMPEVDGIDATRMILEKYNQQGTQPPVIYGVTAFNDF